LDNTVAEQQGATGLWEELLDGESYGQSFVSTRDNLYRIDLGTATYARTNTAPVSLRLLTESVERTEIVSVTVPGPEVQNERPTSFIFPPQPDSAGKRYYFYIESPGATPGNAITLYANSNDQYKEGTAFRNGQAVTGDLAFTAYSQDLYTFSEIVRGFWVRFVQDRAFAVCYGLVMALMSASLVAVLLRPASRAEHTDRTGGKPDQSRIRNRHNDEPHPT